MSWELEEMINPTIIMLGIGCIVFAIWAWVRYKNQGQNWQEFSWISIFCMIGLGLTLVMTKYFGNSAFIIRLGVSCIIFCAYAVLVYKKNRGGHR